MPPIAQEAKSHTATNVVQAGSAVDIDDLIFLGHKNTNTFMKSAHFHPLPRSDKFTRTSMPIDFDQFVIAGNRKSNLSPTKTIVQELKSTTKEDYSLRVLPNDSTDSLSSEDTMITEVDIAFNYAAEATLYPVVTSTNEQMMDIDRLICIGQNYDLIDSRPASSDCSSNIDQYLNQVTSTKFTTPEIVVDVLDTSMLPSYHIPLKHATNQSSIKRSSVLPLDIDHYIHIGTPMMYLRQMGTSKAIGQYTQPAWYFKRTSPTFTRRIKPRFWRKCMGKLKKIYSPKQLPCT